MFDGYGTWHCDRITDTSYGRRPGIWEIEALRFYSSVSRATRSTATVYDVTMRIHRSTTLPPTRSSPLTIRVMGETHRVDPEHAPVIIGRPIRAAARRRTSAFRIPASRANTVVDVRRGQWVGEATGRNGTIHRWPAK